MEQPPQDTSRQTYALAAAGFVEVVDQIGGQDWGQPGLGVWTVRDLVGHTSRALLTVESYLDPTRTTQHPELPTAAAYYRATRATLADPTAVADRGRQAGAALGEDPAAAVAAIAERVLGLVTDSSDDALVTTPVGTMTLGSYLTTRTFELVVHSLDLAAATLAPLPKQLETPMLGCLHTAVELAAASGVADDVLLALTGRRSLPAEFSLV